MGVVLRWTSVTSRAGVRGLASVSPPALSVGSPTPQCAHPVVEVLGRVVGEEVADVDADAAGADDGHALADGTTGRSSTSAYDTTLGWSMPGDRRHARLDAGGDDDLVVRREVGGVASVARRTSTPSTSSRRVK